ncbi:hypothetical protein FUSO5_01535 [Fusobacterium necrophorum BFTR-1]|uniref:lipopolysaccharide biosynthesis protein n=1 Tax=Fusobacterium necrophorum TaxID=859 RepID=UPI0004615743|nr:oligosaccharide flippase family protein [Fusobacterium necrophorum]KDE66897.1 hypothetical protein FUSO5_01535 [Fusobacterium necrophorum BFTR-1]MCF0163517.1 oligosaccharide flippase family protein [Fusobacterium necrophorum]
MNLLKKIFRNEIVKNISFLVSGSVLAIFLPLLFEPFLKRVYIAEDFGKLSLFLKAFGTLIIFSSGCYEMAIMVSNNEDEAKNLVKGNILLNLFVLVISQVIIIGLFYFKFFSSLENYIFLLPIAVFTYSVGISFNNYMIYQKKYREVSINKFLRRAGETLTQYFLKRIFNLGSGLLIGTTLGNLFFMFYNIKIANINMSINLKKIKAVYKKYIEFPKYYLFPQLYNTFSVSIIDIVVFTKFTIADVGYLELTNKVLTLPSALLSESIGKVLLQDISKKINNKDSIKKETKIVLLFLFSIAVIYISIIFLFGPFLFKLIFGNNWEKSGKYAQYLIVYIGLSFITSIFGVVLLALKKIKQNSLWQILKTTSILTLIFFNFTSVKNFLIIYSSINTVFYIAYLVLIIYQVYKYEKEIKI